MKVFLSISETKTRTDFHYGPFAFAPGRAVRVGGQPRRWWAMSYAGQEIVEHVVEGVNQGSIIDRFATDRESFIRKAMTQHAPQRISLIESSTGSEVGHFFTDHGCGLTPGQIDDRSQFWLRSENKLRSREVTLNQFAEVVSCCGAPQFSWITGLLPEDVLTADSQDWRAPSSWEIRHLVGEGSFTGVTGAFAASLVGVTAQNFRKYTARDGASTRQNMSFAMWHLLLHRLGVQAPSFGRSA